MQTVMPRVKAGSLLLLGTMFLSLALAACGSSATAANNPPPKPTNTLAPTATATSTPVPAKPTPTLPPGSSANLIVNPGAENGAADPDGGTPVTTIPGWTIAGGEFDVVQYQASSGNYPAVTDPGPTDRGKNFFCGGPSDDVSTATQTIDVSKDALKLDTGLVGYVLSGWLGGFSDQDDNAALSIQFEDASGKALGKAQIGPVLAADRNNVTGFLSRTTTGKAPKGTRKIVVTLTMTRVSGSANDGYADNLSLTLQGL
ncbi:MAG TPA: hypothetical protein VF099_06030 [Ktedonobacterales bacterium]